MPLDSRLNDHHVYSQNWVMAARPLGVCNRYTPLCVKFSMTNFHLTWCRILSLIQGGTPAAKIRVALYPQLIYEEPQGTMTEPNQLGRGMKVCLNKVGNANRAYPSQFTRLWQTVVEVLRFLIFTTGIPFPIHQTAINSCWGFEIFIF